MCHDTVVRGHGPQQEVPYFSGKRGKAIAFPAFTFAQVPDPELCEASQSSGQRLTGFAEVHSSIAMLNDKLSKVLPSFWLGCLPHASSYNNDCVQEGTITLPL